MSPQRKPLLSWYLFPCFLAPGFVFHEARVIFKNLMFGGFLRLLQLYTLFIITQKNKHYTVTLTAPAQQRHVPVHHFRKQELVPVPESTM